MRETVECVPNFSEGRRKSVVDAIASAIEFVPCTRVFDRRMHADHNRSLLTFVGGLVRRGLGNRGGSDREG